MDLVGIFILILTVVIGSCCGTSLFPSNQADALRQLRFRKLTSPVVHNRLTTSGSKFSNWRLEADNNPKEAQDQDLIKYGLPGQPADVNFKQYAGYVDVNRSAGRSLFYYFVEAATNSSAKPLILWLNGGPMCSSLGMGAMTEIGPFGVNRDGKTLYTREYSWNQVANVLFLESPAGVGFSYSNTTSDYDFPGDKRTARDTYVFLLKWFGRYPQYQGRDFYLIGESYAGYYIPELADIIIQRNKDGASTPLINLKGIMIGNGLINDETDTRGYWDFLFTHALISKQTHHELLEKCILGLHETEVCAKIIGRMNREIGLVDSFNIYAPMCNPNITTSLASGVDPCELIYAQSYLNIPAVQAALHARTNTSWASCSAMFVWKDSASSMFPIYKRMIRYGLRILLYSGDADAAVPVTSTLYSIDAMGIKVIKPWKLWTMPNDPMQESKGYKVLYNGLEFATVRGGGHEVSRSHPDRLMELLRTFLAGDADQDRKT